MNENDVSGMNRPLSNTPSGPLDVLPLVTVCAAVSSFTQETSPPTSMVTVPGTKQPSGVSSHPGTEVPSGLRTVAVAWSANANGAVTTPITAPSSIAVDKTAIKFIVRDMPLINKNLSIMPGASCLSIPDKTHDDTIICGTGLTR